MRTFPDDLVRAQREWTATYRRLADRPGRTELRRRLYRLSARTFFHPSWQRRRPAPAAWWELRELGRSAGNTSERLDG
ncbi:hypothetical protein ACWD0Z_33815 [Streptomyces sp. NPDC003007]